MSSLYKSTISCLYRVYKCLILKFGGFLIQFVQVFPVTYPQFIAPEQTENTHLMELNPFLKLPVYQEPAGERHTRLY